MFRSAEQLACWLMSCSHALKLMCRLWKFASQLLSHLTRTVLQAGLRAYVGKVCMDRNSKDYYQHPLEQNLADTKAFVRHVR